MSSVKSKKNRKRERMMSGLEWAERERKRDQQFGYHPSEDDLFPQDLVPYPRRFRALELGNNQKVVVYVRATTQKQVAKGQRDHDKSAIIRAVKKAGCVIVEIVECVETNSISDWNERPNLRKAIRLAERHNAILVTSTRDRYLRSASYRGTNRSETPSLEEYREFRLFAGMIVYATIRHPKKHGRSIQTKRGQQKSKNKPGRPVGSVAKTPGYRKRMRKKLMPKVLEMRERNATYSQIENETGVSRATAHRWVNCREV